MLQRVLVPFWLSPVPRPRVSIPQVMGLCVVRALTLDDDINSALIHLALSFVGNSNYQFDISLTL